MVTRKSEETPAPSDEIAPTVIEWGKITTPADARAALENAYGAVLESSALFGDGAEFIKDKDKLIGIPFMILEWHFVIDKETNREYVNVLVMNQVGEKARFNDGSTGVRDQLKKVHEEYGIIGIFCKFGLRKSSYMKEVNGKPEKATTYYLSA